MTDYAEQPADLVDIGDGQAYQLKQQIALFLESIKRQLNQLARIDYANQLKLAQCTDSETAERIRQTYAANATRSVELRACECSAVLEVLQRGLDQDKTSFRAYYLRSFAEMYQRYYDFV